MGPGRRLRRLPLSLCVRQYRRWPLWLGVFAVCVLLFWVAVTHDYDPPTPGEPCTTAQLERMSSYERFLASGCLMVFSQSRSPRISVILTAHSRAQAAFTALKSIRLQIASLSFEVLLVDDASTDKTPQLFARIRGVRSVRFDRPYRYAMATNYAVFNLSASSSEFVWLLPDDVELLSPLSLGSLATLLHLHPEAGAAGSKIVLLDKRLQEAGSHVWLDGSVIGYGRGADPALPDYNFVRPVDFCSAAGLMVRRDIFVRLGGFDAALYPMYYEDTDLQMKIRYNEKRTILYQPLSFLLHHEHGTASHSDALRLMRDSHKIFAARWRDQLSTNHWPPEKPYLSCAADRRTGLRLLWIDTAVPRNPLSLRWQRTSSILSSLRTGGHVVTIFPFIDKRRPAHAATLEQQGIEVYALQHDANYDGDRDVDEPTLPIALHSFLSQRELGYDAVIVSGTDLFQHTVDVIKKAMPSAFIVLNAEALLWQTQDHADSLTTHMMNRELDAFGKCQQGWLTAPKSMEMVQQRLGSADLHLIQYGRQELQGALPFMERVSMGFWADFTDTEDSNGDAAALASFLQNVWPAVTRDLRNVHFQVAHEGSVPKKVSSAVKTAQGVSLLGPEGDREGFFAHLRVFVVPHDHGLGVPQRVLEALGRGIPVVMHSNWAAALGVESEAQGVLIAQEMTGMAEVVLRAWTDEALWTKLHLAAHTVATSRFGPRTIEAALTGAIEKVPRATCKRKI